MMMLILGSLGLMLFAMLIVFWPWRRAIKSHSVLSQQQMNKSLTQQRMGELQAELQTGLLSEQDKTEAENELTLAYAEEASVPDEKPSTVIKNSRIGAVLIIALCAVSATYWYANEVSSLQHWQQAMVDFPTLAQRAVIQGDSTVTAEEYQTLALGLRTNLIKKPDDPTGWLLLGRVYSTIGYIEPSIQAFEKALALKPDHLGVLISLSQTLAMSGQPEQLQRAQKLLTQALDIEPEEYDALGLMAIVASQLGDRDLAVKSWRSLQQQIEVSDPLYQSINQRIAALLGNAGVQLIEPEVDEAMTASPSKEQPVSQVLSINVDIAAEFKDGIADNAILFVFAQDALSGNNMPAAVVRQGITTWPVEVNLSDNNAMMASYTLSSLTKAKLVARISLDGDVMPSAGDIQGEIIVDLTTATQSSYQIIINTEVKP